MNRIARRIALTIAALALFGAAEAAAQGRPLRVQVQTSLTFGTLLPGVPTTILTNDPLNAGEFQIRGRRNSDILIQFFLPAELAGPGTSVVPLIFGPASAGFSPDRNINNQILFDPAAPQVFRITARNGQGGVFLGGTAAPGTSVQAGAYSAQLTIQVAYLGA